MGRQLWMWVLMITTLFVQDQATSELQLARISVPQTDDKIAQRETNYHHVMHTK
jgi:hypothetical protein